MPCNTAATQAMLSMGEMLTLKGLPCTQKQGMKGDALQGKNNIIFS